MGRNRAASSGAAECPRRVELALILALAGVILAIGGSRADADSCNLAGESEVGAALAQIERSLDPCGESAAVRDVLREFRRCASRGIRICADRHSERNFIERATDGEHRPTTITWNPGLRTELEWGCNGDPQSPVRRDPVASLLHELVHAVQDCAGLDPADHEFEAVQIENIYRRSRGLCQRTRYGDRLLPESMLVACEPRNCRCNGALPLVSAQAGQRPQTGAGEVSAGDTAQ